MKLIIILLLGLLSNVLLRSPKLQHVPGVENHPLYLKLKERAKKNLDRRDILSVQDIDPKIFEMSNEEFQKYLIDREREQFDNLDESQKKKKLNIKRTDSVEYGDSLTSSEINIEDQVKREREDERRQREAEKIRNKKRKLRLLK
jgi:hypothetical protein